MHSSNFLFYVSNTSEKFETPYNISEEEERILYEQDQIWLEEARSEGRMEWTERKRAEHVQASKVRISNINCYSFLEINQNASWQLTNKLCCPMQFDDFS